MPAHEVGANVRYWIHVKDHCRSILAVTENGRADTTVYSLESDDGLENTIVVRRIPVLLGRSEELIRFMGNRPEHDFRYALDSSVAQRESG